MLHKTISLTLGARRYRVRLHSIDGKTWCAESPRRAADIQLRFNAMRRREYLALRNAIVDNVTDDPEGIATDVNF